MPPLIRIKTSVQKQSVQDLAVLGGQPLFVKPVHVGAPNIGNRQKILERFDQILDRNWLTNDGPFVADFESRIATLSGTKHCIATSNGTLALELAARALGLKGEVIVPSFTFVATAHSLKWQEISPVFCDIETDSFTIDPKKIEALITPRTTGILAVHLWGRACDTDALAAIAKKHHLKLLYDASHALGCSHQGRSIGQFGDAEVFSFHATKFINTFEGGAIVTNNDELANRLRLMKNFGFTGTDKVSYLGINGKMAEPSAAMGITSLESMDEFVTANQKNYDAYQKCCENILGLKLIPYSPREKNNYQYISIQIDSVKTGITRDELIRVLHAENILARRYFHPGIHKMEPYLSEKHRPVWDLPYTELATQQMICLPTGQSVTTNTIKSICRLIAFIVVNSTEVSTSLGTSTKKPRLIQRLSELSSTN